MQNESYTRKDTENYQHLTPKTANKEKLCNVDSKPATLNTHQVWPRISRACCETIWSF